MLREGSSGHGYHHRHRRQRQVQRPRYPGNVELKGTNLADQMYGLAGDDELVGFDGDDVLEGGAGADVLWGGYGFDYRELPRLGQGVSHQPGQLSFSRAGTPPAISST